MPTWSPALFDPYRLPAHSWGWSLQTHPPATFNFVLSSAQPQMMSFLSSALSLLSLPTACPSPPGSHLPQTKPHVFPMPSFCSTDDPRVFSSPLLLRGLPALHQFFLLSEQPWPPPPLLCDSSLYNNTPVVSCNKYINKCSRWSLKS